MMGLARSGSPLFLYGVGQLMNLVLTLLVAQLVFGGWLLTPPLRKVRTRGEPGPSPDPLRVSVCSGC